MAPRSRTKRTSATSNKNKLSTTKPASRQSSLTFQNRITKPSSQSSSKDKKSSSSVVAAEIKAAKLLQEAATASEAEEIKLEPEIKHEPDTDVKTEVEVNVKPEPEAVAEAEAATVLKPKEKNIPIRSQNSIQQSGPEAEARRVTDARIKKYWRGKEAERKTKRVHQQELSLHEKILREFDMSYQFGPCIGIARSKRWMRAEKLGLNPPIEVLAILVKEEDGDQKEVEKKFEKAHMEILVNSRSGVVAQ